MRCASFEHTTESACRGTITDACSCNPDLLSARDPLTKLMMQADGVTEKELVMLLDAIARVRGLHAQEQSVQRYVAAQATARSGRIIQTAQVPSGKPRG